ncbi:hypothetical protein, partial [Pseudomonas tohonis]|uniref:hypothetical protein n=1 Tax=Pseudomonas tohonis TaxID=2725477 RepID=UPI001F2941D0
SRKKQAEARSERLQTHCDRPWSNGISTSGRHFYGASDFAQALFRPNANRSSLRPAMKGGR